ncbi:universal stress protein [Nocardioides gilvus]|uniref:universal stress protein n=1 Tax=Nocardioides gilvus TaxID=1735589 RepID=UPI000D74276D|nr:universal stress protein [Nocardioides gilvus]
MTVVVGYIPNEYGEAALIAGIDEARRRRTGIVVVNATRGDTLVDERFIGAAGASEVQERLAALDLVHEFRQTMGGDIAEDLLTVAREVSAEVIVIGVRHRTPVGKMLMGSVAQKVLLDAPCAVLAVKPER